MFGVLALGLGGCAGLSGGFLGVPALAKQPPQVSLNGSTQGVPAAGVVTDETGRESPLPVAHLEPRGALTPEVEATTPLLALQTAPAKPSLRDSDVEIEEYDPWEPFNETMFEVNYRLDRHLIKPVAKGYNFVMPDRLQQMISDGFDNIRFVPRLVNSLAQGKFRGAGRELGRFLINSTAGIAGLFDIAKQEFGIEKSSEDAGQTLGVWGAGPGPYLVLPLMPPLTVRDGIGRGIDMFLDPLGYVLPFFWDRFGMKAGDTINDRALNLELFQGFEDTTIDLYSAVRNAYLQRRYQLIQE